MDRNLALWIHLVATFLVLTTLATMAWHVHTGGGRRFPARLWLMISHGIALTLVLISGFALKGLLGVAWPAWVVGKLALWLSLGGIAGLIFGKPKLALLWWWTIWILGASAATLGIFKFL